MGLDRYVSTPGAILIGSGLIALGLFFGLQGREEAPPPRAAPASTALTAPNAAPPQRGAPVDDRREAPPPGPAPAAASRADVAQQAAQALEAQRKRLVERCWKPSAARSPQPPTVRYVFNFTFDAEGRQAARGLSEDRETSRPDVTSCLNGALEALVIPAPGAPVQVEVPFSLP